MFWWVFKVDVTFFFLHVGVLVGEISSARRSAVAAATGLLGFCFYVFVVDSTFGLGFVSVCLFWAQLLGPSVSVLLYL